MKWADESLKLRIDPASTLSYENTFRGPWIISTFLHHWIGAQMVHYSQHWGQTPKTPLFSTDPVQMGFKLGFYALFSEYLHLYIMHWHLV